MSDLKKSTLFQADNTRSEPLLEGILCRVIIILCRVISRVITLHNHCVGSGLVVQRVTRVYIDEYHVVKSGHLKK